MRMNYWIPAVAAAIVLAVGVGGAHAAVAVSPHNMASRLVREAMKVAAGREVRQAAVTPLVDFVAERSTREYTEYALAAERPENVRGTYAPVQSLMYELVNVFTSEDHQQTARLYADTVRSMVALDLDCPQYASVDAVREHLVLLLEASIPDLTASGISPKELVTALTEGIVAGTATYLLLQQRSVQVASAN